MPQEETHGDRGLTIVIVTYNAAKFIESCLRTVYECAPRGFRLEVHLVDNASVDRTSDLVEKQFPSVTIHRQTENMGFGRANNLVLDGVKDEVVLLLNPDTELRPGVLDHLIDVIDSDEAIGVLGCRLERADGTLDPACKRSSPSPADALQYFLRIPNRSGARYHSPDVGEFEFGYVDAINGAFMLVRTTAMQSVGTFDPQYWMYGEDLDWCRRFKDAGWRVAYDGRVSAIHLKGATSGKYRSPYVNFQFHRSMAIYYRKFESGKHLWLDRAVYCAIVLKCVNSMIRSGFMRGFKGVLVEIERRR